MEEEKQKFIDINPLSKWKRLLVFLGDYFIAFILSFILFNLVVFPSAKIICDTEKQSDTANALEQKALKMLKDDGYLFTPKDGASFEEDVDYTCKVFLSYYAFDDVSVDPNNPQYGHKLENEVVRHYYENKIKNTSQYIADFKEVNEADKMFEIGETVDSIVLKSDYKTVLANELLEVKDSASYSVAMTNYRDHVFAKLFYLHVYNHVTENDYVKGDESFNGYMDEARQIMGNLQWVVTVSTLVTIVMTWSLVFILYPMVNKENRTITMSVMGVSKLHYNSLGCIDKKTVMIQSFYHFVILLSSILFLPILFFGLAYSFNLPLLFILTAISAGLIVVSGVFIIFNEHNRSGSDILTNTVMVPTSELDALYIEREKDGE